MIHPHFETVLAALRAAVGLPDLQPDADGTCQLVIDDKLVVNIGWSEPSSQVVFFAPVGSLQEAVDRAGALAALLRANLFWEQTGGATLSLAQDGHTVVLAYQAPGSQLAQEDVPALLGWMIDLAGDWQSRVEELARAAEAHAAPGGVGPQGLIYG
ncbi:Tir chaperone protein (CesT) family protein [Variovorax sp. OK605]|uniref:type III secretion system chaperone n=1 Tax=Variovorax sp. OK605 TaxID=1855317 RepID=UPI0008EE97B3|nr:type III secretion system chaperone [Variovorax sp. OK605]SFP86579.1 Tir chaperone protein (CesT) family protein [Variovorax sp. OK605]